jgi:hypothetical protein
MQIDTQTKKNMLSLKDCNTGSDNQVSRWPSRHFGNCKCVLYKMGNYNPILMQIAIQTKKSMPSSEITKPETFAKFQDDRRRHFVY